MGGSLSELSKQTSESCRELEGTKPYATPGSFGLNSSYWLDFCYLPPIKICIHFGLSTPLISFPARRENLWQQMCIMSISKMKKNSKIETLLLPSCHASLRASNGATIMCGTVGRKSMQSTAYTSQDVPISFKALWSSNLVQCGLKG